MRWPQDAADFYQNHYYFITAIKAFTYNLCHTYTTVHILTQSQSVYKWNIWQFLLHPGRRRWEMPSKPCMALIWIYDCPYCSGQATRSKALNGLRASNGDEPSRKRFANRDDDNHVQTSIEDSAGILTPRLYLRVCPELWSHLGILYVCIYNSHLHELA